MNDVNEKRLTDVIGRLETNPIGVLVSTIIAMAAMLAGDNDERFLVTLEQMAISIDETGVD